VPYLRTRLAELYREAAQSGASPAELHPGVQIRMTRLPGLLAGALRLVDELAP
jgi:hypothetical protein